MNQDHLEESGRPFNPEYDSRDPRRFWKLINYRYYVNLSVLNSPSIIELAEKHNDNGIRKQIFGSNWIERRRTGIIRREI